MSGSKFQLKDEYSFVDRKNLLFGFLLILLVTWLFFVGIKIWDYASSETEPPVFDALSYVQKAQEFWTSIDEGKMFNPLSIEPTIRPFGTVLLTYPLGFTEDFRGFYFRSMYIPIVVLALAFLSVIPIYKLDSKQLTVYFAFAIAATSAPCNYQFQLVQGKNYVLGTWGFVDTYLSSITALATAFAVRSNGNVSLKCAWLCALLASYTIFVKPVGALLMIAIASVWVIINFPKKKDGVRENARFGWGILAFVIVYGLTFSTVLNSEYFSPEHARFGLKGISLISSMYPSSPTFLDVLEKFHLSIGGGLTLSLLLGLAISARRQWRYHLYAAVLVLTIGVWLWLIKTSINNVRYFLPFLVMGIIIVVPSLIDFVRWLSKKMVVLAIVILLAPTTLIAFLLEVDTPSRKLQHLAGINLTSNIHHEEVKQAQSLVDDLTNRDVNKTYIVYYVGTQPSVRAFQSVLDYERIVKGARAKTIPALPIDWVREHAYRLDEMLRARFIVFEIIDDAITVLDSKEKITTFSEEQIMIRAWLSNLGISDGVRVYSQSSSLRLLEVIDIDAIEFAASKLYDRYSWRKAFADGFSRRWVTKEKVDNLPSNLLSNQVDFFNSDGNIIAALVGVAAELDENDFIVSIYINHIKPINEKDGTDNWHIAVGLLKEDFTSYRTMYSPFYPYLSKYGNIREYKVRFPGETIEKNHPLSISIFSPEQNQHYYLTSPIGDWGGKRIVITSKHK